MAGEIPYAYKGSMSEINASVVTFCNSPVPKTGLSATGGRLLYAFPSGVPEEDAVRGDIHFGRYRVV